MCTIGATDIASRVPSCRHGARRSPKVTEVLPMLYLRGISTKDFEPALAEFFGSEYGLSASTIQRLTREWTQELAAFRQRDLSHVDYVYLWADGVHFNIRLEDDRLCCPVLIGVRADGHKELVAVGGWLSRIDRVVVRTAARSQAARHARACGRYRRWRTRLLGRLARGIPGQPRAAMLGPQKS
ncbi:MAG: transposase [Acidobacteria bacterium]|nr:transposase [Acidobacteriota bacterium]